MIPLAKHGQAGRAFDDLFDRGTDHGIAVSAHENHRTIAQRGGESVTALHRSHETDSFVYRWAVGGEKFAIVVKRAKLDRQNAEDCAPLRMCVADAGDVGSCS